MRGRGRDSNVELSSSGSNVRRGVPESSRCSLPGTGHVKFPSLPSMPPTYRTSMFHSRLISPVETRSLAIARNLVHQRETGTTQNSDGR